ncbi:MAG: GNAT family N-acetyltransferase [Anaerolineae bacterium]|nr:GNAT family N-acetyltransferase [Anaerolineae bacterium]
MIQGEKVRLRAIEREDLPRYVRWLNDPEVMRYFGIYRPSNLEDEEAWYASQRADDSSMNFAIETLEDSQHVGGCGFSHIDWRNRSAECGILIGERSRWGQGLGTDAMRTLVRYGFQQLNLHRIYLRVFEENQRAIHIYEKAGFQIEGRWRDAEFRHGRYHDIIWMSILSDSPDRA